ncbi:flagellar motor switch protein FliG [Epibacterium ulvae]|uniref:flagellar motor switch protein FliG n=1 Tax=Epibacterium ulvae TaxID=1156985 RepID=UPI001BFC6571|nr:FliG C-terminal domain-containing protein [Epibacterium ulvae]MBT8155400.1 flagellar motor switch protein FliG [Epibacterium ulvae]
MEQDTALALPAMGMGDEFGDFPALAPMGGMAPAPPPMADTPALSTPGPKVELSGKAKAAIVVRLLLNEGADIPIEELPEDLQTELTRQMGKMSLVDRNTLNAVAGEFADLLDNVGLSFPNGLAGALSAMEGKISRHTYSRLRKEAGVRQFGNPWDRLKQLPAEDLATLAEAESIEVAAVLLSMLDTGKAAAMLACLPGPLARRITYAVRQTGSVSPETVDRIGLSLAAQVDARPEMAFADSPGERVGAILTESPAAKREEVMDALDEEDEEFATDVRKSLYTYALIGTRLSPTDVPKITRVVPQQDLVTAIAFASNDEDTESSEFLLANMSTRMATNIREEVAERSKVNRKQGEAAMSNIISALREMIVNGEIELKSTEEDEEGE